MTRKLIGHCGVDSGLIMIIDPCYVSDQPMLANEKKWSDFCKAIYKETIVYDEKTKKDVVKTISILPAELCNGVISNTYIGDGNYPVYADIDEDDNVRSLTIDFYNDEDEDE